MGSDNNWLYFTLCPIVTASCRFYDKEMSSSRHNWLFLGILWVCLLCEEYLSLGCGALLRGPNGFAAWYTFSLCVCVGGGCLMIRHCIAYWLMRLGPKPRVVGVIGVPKSDHLHSRSDLETIEWETSLCHRADGWLLSGPIHAYSLYISIQQ